MAPKDSTSIVIRKAAESDGDALLEFIQPFVDEGKLLPRTTNEVRDLLPNFFVVEMNGEIIGCAALEIYSWKLAEIRSLAVAPQARGLGIGKLLVDACVERARELEILEVMAITSSIAFFRSCGFDYTLTGEKRAMFVQTRDL